MRLVASAVLLLATVCLSGCVSRIPLQTTFDPTEVSFIHENGTNTISGSAFIRQRGGGIVNCAGYEVDLIPKGAYSSERIGIIYGTTSGPGYFDFSKNMFGGKAPAGIDPSYLHHTRSTTCDVDGKFEFHGLATGSYFITAKVSWEVDYSVEGGYLMTPVTLSGRDEVKRVVLSP